MRSPDARPQSTSPEKRQNKHQTLVITPSLELQLSKVASNLCTMFLHNPHIGLRWLCNNPKWHHNTSHPMCNTRMMVSEQGSELDLVAQVHRISFGRIPHMRQTHLVGTNQCRHSENHLGNRLVLGMGLAGLAKVHQWWSQWDHT